MDLSSDQAGHFYADFLMDFPSLSLLKCLLVKIVISGFLSRAIP